MYKRIVSCFTILSLVLSMIVGYIPERNVYAAEGTSKVNLDKQEINLTVNGTETLTATVESQDITNKAVTFESSDPNVVTVTDAVYNENDGTSITTITAVGAGQATITATASGGETFSTCTVTVEEESLEESRIFMDDFNDGNADGWTTYTSPEPGHPGGWFVEDGKFKMTKDGSPGINVGSNGTKAIADGTNFKDFIYEADITVGGIGDGDSQGLLFRVTNPIDNNFDGYNGYYVCIRKDGILELGKVTDTWHFLKGEIFVGYPTVHLQVEAVGNNIKVYANGVLKLDYTDTDADAITTAGAIGLRTWWGIPAFDNIRVRDISIPATDAPTFSLAEGVYNTEQSVELNAVDAEIRYTTDGSIPDESSTLYSGAISISETTQIKAIAIKEGEMTSDVAVANYFIQNEASGFADDFVDGDSSSWTTYKGNKDDLSQTEANGVYTFVAPKGCKAVIEGEYNDFIVEGDINPYTSPNSSGFIFRAESFGDGADSLNGYFVGINQRGFIEVCKFVNATWKDMFKVPADVTADKFNNLKVLGIGSRFWIYVNGEYVTDFTDTDFTSGQVGMRAWDDSNGNITYDNFKVTALSSLVEKVTTPVVSPNGGSFKDLETVTITCATPGAEIHYTTDGSEPTVTSEVYSAPITITETTIVKAIAVNSGMDNSEIASATFTKLSESFSDNFDDNNADGWTTYGGTWSADAGSYTVNAGGGYKAVADGTNFANFTYEADVTIIGADQDSDNTGLIFRVSEPTEGADNLKGYYAGIKRDGFVQLGRFNNDWTELANIPYKVNADGKYHFKVEAKGKNIDVYVDGTHVISVVDDMWTSGAIGMRTWQVGASYDNIVVTDTGAYTEPVYDWSWVKGAVFVPTNVVNELQQWKEYNHEINDRELSYAHEYGINLVRVYLHNLLWENEQEKFMANLEDFLTLADKHQIKVELVLFDDCWNDHPDYNYDPNIAPRYGAHNSRWVEAPGDDYKALYNDPNSGVKEKLEAYVKGVVGTYLNDERIAFWNIYNEPSNGEGGLMDQVTKQIMNDSRRWIKYDLESSIPVTSTGAQFSGSPFSDFITWHPYDGNYSHDIVDNYLRRTIKADASTLADECMQRNDQTVPGIVSNFYDKGTGFVMWEFGIGRDNCRFPWGSDTNPLNYEPEKPFHGLVYPDGHPWDVNDVKAIKGEGFDALPLYRVQYFGDGNFTDLVKTSITPRIDFDLGNETGTGSPDASAGIGEDNFSIRWVGTIKAENSGEHTIYVDSDNIARLWVGDTQVINKISNTREEVSGTIDLEAGKNYAVKVEYAHGTGDSSMHVKWSGPSLNKSVLLPVYADKAVSSVSIESETLGLKVEESQKLIATIDPMDASNQDVIWSSDKPGVAIVDENGTVTGLAEGTATITVTTVDGNHTDTCVVTVSQGSTFKNPIVPVSGEAGSADPSVVFKDGYYYYCKSDKDASILVAKARRLQDIGSVPRVTVYTPSAGTMYSKGLWAPELQYINGKWYIYFAADNGDNANHRMYVLESDTQDPQGTYTFKGKVAAPTDRWAIDGTVLEKDDGSLYFVWSGWEGYENVRQNLYIAPMSNPWTISGERVMISTPTEPWELNGTPNINEGPEILKKDGKIFIVYSASGSWGDDYCLGMLTNTDGDVMNPASWTKTGSVFSKAPTAYGSGHNCFTVSPDGTEDWIVYHAGKNSGGSWGNRSIRAQKFAWNPDGTPNFGTPVAYGEAVQEPSGTPKIIRYKYEAEQVELGGTVKVSTSDNASGGKTAGHIDTVGSDYVLFNVEAAKAGTYTLTLMAANGSSGGAIAQQDVSVNGGFNQTINHKNYGWNRFNPSSIDVVLNEGNNTIKITKKTNFAEIDYITLEAVEDSGIQSPVEIINVDKQNITLRKGQTAELTASIKPASAINNVVFSSSNLEVATVSKNSTNSATGAITLMVTAVEPGTATIRVESIDDENIYAECTVEVLGDPTEPDLSLFTVDQFDSETLDSAWSIFQETSSDWSLVENPGAMTIHTKPTDVYQDNNSQNNVFLRTVGSEDFEIVTKLTAPIRLNHQQAGLFVWQDADNFVKLAHVWVDGKTIETAYELGRSYKKPGNFAPHPGQDTITFKIKKIGNVYTTYYWDGYQWIQAADSVTANLSNIQVGFFANNIVANDNRIDVTFDYFGFRTIQGGVNLDKKALTLQVDETAQLTNNGESGQDIIWSSSNPEIATVDSTGLVKAISAGRATIKAVSSEGDFKDQCVVTVSSSTTQPEILLTDDFDNNNADGWSTYGGTWQVTEGEYTVNSGAGYKAVFDEQSFTDYVLEADVQITSGTEAGLIFRVSNPEVGADAFNGYYLGINAANKSAVLGHMMDGQWNEIASKNLPINREQWYHLKVVVNGGHIQAYINDNSLNTNGYPKFDVLENSHLATGKIGVRAHFADAKFDNIKVSSYTEEVLDESYINSVMPGIADPYVLYYEGIYYLYGTHTADWPNMQNGIKVYTSKDLVNWTEQGWALHKDNSWGAKQFWAPEVIEKDGTFYMYYAVEEHLAVATSKSPLGPFIQEVQEPIHLDTKEIDAHVFTDDDGKQYFYFVRFTGGNQLWVAELNEDMKSIKEDTLTFVFGVSQDWEKSPKAPRADINEGPFVIKHNGTYYMTYSGNHFESPDYGVGYATAPTPMGPWTKYEYNPIMKSNALVPGAGHHSLVYSPDGTELFMVYHAHNKVGTTEPRKLAIDRVHFVPQENGPDIMEVWGPTMTPQPMPSSNNSKVEVNSIIVTGEGGATTIDVKNGTLKMSAEVLPENAEDKSVTWTIVNGADYATISAAGLLTAKANGKVTVKATSVSYPEVSGICEVTISGQQEEPTDPEEPENKVTQVTVNGTNSVVTITTKGGTLQMVATVLPADAENNNVTWTIVSGTNYATISAAGLLTAKANGKVIVKATSISDPEVSGTCEITISGQTTSGDSDNGSSSSGGSGSNGGSTPTNKTEASKVEGNQITLPSAKADSKGGVAIEVSTQNLENAISNSKDRALTIKASIEGEAKEVKASLPADQLDIAQQKDIKTVDLDLGLASLSFEPKLFTQNIESPKNLELSVAKVDTDELSQEIKSIIGSAPIYDFNANVDGNKISNFGEGNVTISVDYNLENINDIHKIVVYYISDSGNLEIVRNAQYNEKTGKVEFSVNHFSKYSVVINNVEFNDIEGLDWAKESIEALAARQIIDGVGNNNFAPKDKVTRAQFIKMLMNALDLVDENAKSTFKDVNEGTWYYSAVASAEELGIVNGKSDGNYGINDRITRQEMAAMAYRASQVANINLRKVTEANDFSDEDQISSYAAEAVAAMQQANVINGMGNSKFEPRNNATRAQAAKIIYSLISF